MNALQKLTGPSLTDEQVKKGAGPRIIFRDEIVKLRADWLNSDKKYEISFKLLNLENQYKKIAKFFEDELVWINANVEVSEREIQKRKTKFYETYQSLIDGAGLAAVSAINSTVPEKQQEAILYFPFTQFKDYMGKQIKIVETEKEEVIKKEEEKESNKTTTDNISQAAKDVLKWTSFAIFIILALRVASFAANDILWMPYPYRIVSFFYTFIFGFIWVPYYLVQAIRNLINPEIQLPRFESVFPLYEYDQNKELTIYDKLFGYPNSEELCKWIQSKREDYENCRKIAALPTGFFEKLMEEKQKEAQG
jgi:hypothetical protein